MKRVVLFDLGDTLVGYFRKTGFAPVLRAAVEAAGAHVHALGLATTSIDEAVSRISEEDFEAEDWSIRPFDARLGRLIFIPFYPKQEGANRANRTRSSYWPCSCKKIT